MNSLFKLLIDFLFSFLKKDSKINNLEDSPIKEEPKISQDLPQIDWSDLEAPISKFFKVKDALYLHSWNIYHIPSEEEKKEIVSFAATLDTIVERFGEINIHCWIRPTKVNCSDPKYQGKDYNKEKKGSSVSGHIKGKAADFNFVDQEGVEACAKMRAKLQPWLEPLGLRMEDIVGPWIHLDNKPVVGKRFFKP
jgi:hypothetical protein